MPHARRAEPGAAAGGAGCLDLVGAEVRIMWQLQRASGQLLRRRTKTEASDVALPLPGICVAALRGRRQRQDSWREAAGPAWHDSGLVLTTRYGLPVEPRNFHRDFRARCRKAGVREISVHTTRRTCASLLVVMDVHPRVIMQILRHSQIAVTMNVYGEVTSRETPKALKRLGKELQRA